MKPLSAVLVLTLIATLGAGCEDTNLPDLSFLPDLPKISPLSFFTKDVPAEDLDLAPNATIVLLESTLAPLNLGQTKYPRILTVEEWLPADWVKLNWIETYQVETEASIEAREAAEHTAGVGEAAEVPAPVYQTVSREGRLASDALDDGRRILLPSAWKEEDQDLTGSENTLFWLSRAQYDELVSTRHTHLEISAVDAKLDTLVDVAEKFKDLITRLQGGDTGVDETDYSDITEIEAQAEWGTYIFKYNDKRVEVRTIEAENKIASFTVLANPDNPLILEVALKPWAYGTEALGAIDDDFEVSGYSIKELSVR